jgi:hypothetical protein
MNSGQVLIWNYVSPCQLSSNVPDLQEQRPGPHALEIRMPASCKVEMPACVTRGHSRKYICSSR